ncbi:hypothetical protein AB1L05_08905 [Cytobacillus horneckiae]|uniref:hypothetical protein n=1 Tax=Cytobacillus horneckiae TaxID=549687 RepID=UPI0039A3BD3D
MKIKEWLIKKLVGDTPIIMNVTLMLDEPIIGAKESGIFDKCNIDYSDRLKGGVKS